MRVTSRRSTLDGIIAIPGSKSHTIRAVLIASLARGTSVIESPLVSLDTLSAADAMRAFGIRIQQGPDDWTLHGTGTPLPTPDTVIDVGNSGTTLYLVMGIAALTEGLTILTGDNQIRRRTAQPLLDALHGLGIDARSTRNNGMAPIMVQGPFRGGATTVEGISSQYLSSLLLACPLAQGDSEITVVNLNEHPYVRMTLDWLASQGIRLDIAADYSHAHIPGGQAYHPFQRRIPGDFSSAAFPLCAGVLTGRTVTLEGLDPADSQGDKQIIDILRFMGADITVSPDAITVQGGNLRGAVIDLNAMPDALPMLSVVACFAEGVTVLHNVAQARIKETDRIAVMAAELGRLGAQVRELPDGLEITGGGLRGGMAHGHGDHRVVMALAVAGLASEHPITIDTAEAAEVTFPGFWERMRKMGARFDLEEN